SGLKTAVRQAAMERAPLDEAAVADLCASFQGAVAGALADRTSRALERFRHEYAQTPRPVLVAAGGVAANGLLRKELTRLCSRHGFEFVAPPVQLCTDNAAMIAWAGLERLGAGLAVACEMSAAPRPRWP